MLYKSNLLTLKLLYIVGIYIDEYCVLAQVTVFTHVMVYDVDWDR